MTAAVVALAVVLAGTVGAIVWLAKTALDDRSRTADTFFDLASAQGDLERAGFELEVARKAMNAALERSARLEKELSHVLDHASLGEGAAADDVAARLRRLASEWASTGAGGADPLPAEPYEAMSLDPAAGSPDARR